MKRNPLIGFAVIAVVGIVLILVMGVWGGNTAKERANGSDKAKTAAMTPDKIFQQNCSSCHGNNLEGGVGPNLQKIGSQLSKDRILTQIQKGGGAMPGGIIAGKEADQVATWLSKKK